MQHLASLPWLPDSPDDFRDRCKSMANGEDARFLATHALDLTQLGQLARAMQRLDTLVPLTPFKLAILSSSTVDFLLPPLIASGARHGVAMEVFGPPYGQVMQQALDPDSEVNRFKSDAILLYLDHRFFPPPQEIGDMAALQATVEAAIQ